MNLILVLWYNNYVLEYTSSIERRKSAWAKPILQEESYMSIASFLDNDDIPVYNKNDSNCDNDDFDDNGSNKIIVSTINNYKFSGSRIKRGL